MRQCWLLFGPNNCRPFVEAEIKFEVTRPGMTKRALILVEKG